MSPDNKLDKAPPFKFEDENLSALLKEQLGAQTTLAIDRLLYAADARHAQFHRASGVTTGAPGASARPKSGTLRAERIRSTVMLLFGPTRSPLGVRQLFLPFAAVVAILAIGVDVAQWLRGAPLWVDEEAIALNLRDRTFSELSGPLWLGQAAPLGWMFVERAAILTFGTCELSLRLPPLLFGIGTIAAALWAGARWLNPSRRCCSSCWCPSARGCRSTASR